MIDYFARVENLSRFSKEELCDIYVNLSNFEYDRRLGASGSWFENLPNQNTHWFHKLIKRETKENVLKKYMAKIEQLTTTYERKRYLYVVIMKIFTDQEFSAAWGDIEGGQNGENQGNN